MLVNNIYAPRAAELFGNNNITALSVLTRKINFTFLAIAVVNVLIFYFFGQDILNFWGSEFSQGLPVLFMLLIGQTLNLVTGPTGVLLMMTGNENLMFRIMLFSLFVTFMFTYFFTLQFGLVGAACAYALLMCLENTLKVFLSKILKFRLYL